MAGPRYGGSTARTVGRGLFASLVLLSACYSTRPLPSAIPARDARIFGRLTEQASRQMEQLIGRDAVAVEGIVTEIRENEWELRVLRVDQIGGHSVRWNRELVAFPAGAFTSVVERRLEKTRTALFTGGLAAGAILIARLIGLGGFFAGGGDGDPAPPQ